MKNLNRFKSIALAGIISLGMIACSDDDDDQNVIEEIAEASTTGRLYATNNTNGNITIYEISDDFNTSEKLLITPFNAADGINYDNDEKTLVVANRIENKLAGFRDTDEASNGDSLSVNIDGTTDMDNPREVAQKGDFYVVADNQNQSTLGTTNRLFVYTKDGSTGKFNLRNTITVEFALWGITFVGDDLYAVVDQTNDLAMFANFLNTSGDQTLAWTKRITIEGIVRTHGIVINENANVAVLTDIGNAADDADGGFHLIENFTDKFSAVADGGTMPVANNQVRVSGSNTQMGNPVDVDYDRTTNTVFIAEAANSGGKILGFNNIGGGGNLSPIYNKPMNGASAIDFDRR